MKKSIVRIFALSLVAIIMCVTLASCATPNADPEKALAALKDNGYTAEKVEDSGLGAIAIGLLKAAGIDGVKTVVSGTNKDGEHITIFYFEDSAAANAEWEDVQKYADGEKDDDSEWVVEKSGKMIYFGTKNAVKAAK